MAVTEFRLTGEGYERVSEQSGRAKLTLGDALVAVDLDAML